MPIVWIDSRAMAIALGNDSNDFNGINDFAAVRLPVGQKVNRLGVESERHFQRIVRGRYAAGL